MNGNNLLECPICFDIPNHPIKLTCDHYFCESCLLEWLEKDQNKTCPVCRQVIQSQASSYQNIRENLVSFGRVL